MLTPNLKLHSNQWHHQEPLRISDWSQSSSLTSTESESDGTRCRCLLAATLRWHVSNTSSPTST